VASTLIASTLADYAVTVTGVAACRRTCLAIAATCRGTMAGALTASTLADYAVAVAGLAARL
jgi:hypothetical protein